MKHPEVKDAGVVGLPDDTSGELPLGFVVLKSTKKNVTVKELEDYVNNQVAPYKKLRGGVKFVKQIPRSAAGKILRIRLKMMMVAMIESLEIKIVGRKQKVTFEVKDNIMTDNTQFCSPDVTFGEFFLACVDKYDNSTCIIDSVSGESYSFRRVVNLSKSMAVSLRKRGLKSGDSICLFSSNCLQHLVVVVGTALLGGRLYSCPPENNEEEVRTLLEEMECKCLIVSEDCAQVAIDACANSKDAQVNRRLI